MALSHPGSMRAILDKLAGIAKEGDALTMELATGFLEHKDAHVRSSALKALAAVAEQRSKLCRDACRALLGHVNPDVRAAVAETLARMAGRGKERESVQARRWQGARKRARHGV